MHAYLEDLAKLGAYGKDKGDVARTFIEAGIRDAIEKRVIGVRTTEVNGAVKPASLRRPAK